MGTFSGTFRIPEYMRDEYNALLKKYGGMWPMISECMDGKQDHKPTDCTRFFEKVDDYHQEKNKK
jgi:hypothetical protein